MADKAIEVLLDEKRNFSPPKAFRKAANMKSAATFNAARKNPQAFWAKAAKELHWFKPWKKSSAMEHALGEVVHRREAQRLL
jgi:acetyl-CoA synthetase